MSTAQRSVQSHVFYSFLGNMVAPVTALATAPLLARGLDTAGRGELAGATAPLLLATAVGGFGVPESLIYHVAKRPNASPGLVRAAVGLLSLVGSAVMLAIFLLAGALSRDHAGNPNAELHGLIQLSCAAVLPTLLLLLPRAIAAGRHEWRLLAVERSLFGGLRLVWVVALFVFGALTPRSATIALLVSPLISSLILLPGAVTYARARPREGDPKPIASPWRAIPHYGFRVWLGALSGIVLTRVSQVVMVPLSDEHQTGLFAVAVTIGELPLIVSGAVRDVMFSAESAGGDAARLQQAARITTMLTFVASLGLAATMAWWLPWVFGASFAPALGPALVVLAATVLGSTGSVAGAGLGGRGRPGLRSWAMFVGAIANIAVLVVMTPRVGAMGGALSMLAGSTIAGTMNVVWLHRRFGIAWTGFYGWRGDDTAQVARLVHALRARVARSAI